MAQTLQEQKISMGYGPCYREYFIPLKDSQTAGYILSYCPWCGSQLPESLRDEWFEILEKEYGLDDPWGRKQQKLIPQEFTTDDWWKNRKL